MRVLVFGAGAVGSLIGGRLALSGQEVTLVARPAHAGAIRSGGLHLEGRLPAVVHPGVLEELPRGTDADVVLLAVKSFDLATSAEAVARSLPGPRPTLTLQNGLGNGAATVDGLGRGGWRHPAEWVVVGINSVPATFAAPGIVRQAGEGEVLLGAPGPEVPSARVELFRSIFERAGLTVRVVPDIARELWRKLLVNAAINPVTADHGVLNGQLARDPWRGQALRLLHEALKVAAAEGQPFASEEAEADLWRVVRATAENRSSMLQDIERGRPTEIDAISGAILEAADRHGVSVPMTRRAVERIRARTGLPRAQ